MASWHLRCTDGPRGLRDHTPCEGLPEFKERQVTSSFQTIANGDLDQVNGGNDFLDALGGALKIVTSPLTATYNGIRGTVGALQQGHTVSDSLANGLVQAAGIKAPNLATIPANPNLPRK